MYSRTLPLATEKVRGRPIGPTRIASRKKGTGGLAPLATSSKKMAKPRWQGKLTAQGGDAFEATKGGSTGPARRNHPMQQQKWFLDFSEGSALGPMAHPYAASQGEPMSFKRQKLGTDHREKQKGWK